MTPTKFCYDCKYVYEPFGSEPKCKHTKSILSVSLLSGHPEFAYCRNVRLNSGECKPEGLLFEPKISIWKRIKLYV